MYKGQLARFPKEIVEKMLEYQMIQGNRRNLSVFENTASESRQHGGFNWSETIEGRKFWAKVIVDKEFNIFFIEYPKQKELPKAICIKRNVNNILWNDYIKWLNGMSLAHIEGTVNFYYGYNNTQEVNFWNEPETFGEDVKVLSLTEWHHLFIKTKTKEMTKEIIGYIVPYDINVCILKNDVLIKDGSFYCKEERRGKGPEYYLSAELVETWTPVYKKEFKIGDWIICDGSSNPKADLIVDINDDYYKTKKSIGNSSILGFAKNRNDLRLATKEEIAEASKVTYVMGIVDTFELTVTDGKCFHNSENITDYVKQVQRTYKGFIQNKTFGSYAFNVKDIIISKTGCENKETLLSQWLTIKL